MWHRYGVSLLLAQILVLGLDGRRRSVGWIGWATECQELSVDEVANLGGEIEEAEVIFAVESRKKSVSVILERGMF